MKTVLLGLVLSFTPATDVPFELGDETPSLEGVAKGGRDGGRKRDDEEREEDVAGRFTVPTTVFG